MSLVSLPKPIGAPLNNKNGEKFDTDAKKIKLCEQLVEHLEKGLDQRNFPPCDWDTVERYCDLYPDFFDRMRINEAIRKGREFHEANLRNIATGKNVKGNASAAIFLAKNKLGMRDRVDVREVPRSNLSEASDDELDELIARSNAEIAERNSK